VGALVTHERDEVLVIMEGGRVVRSSVSEVPATGKDTMGVTFAKPDHGDRIISVASNPETRLDEADAVPSTSGVVAAADEGEA
jgi:DNA gyrase subunit A